MTAPPYVSVTPREHDATCRRARWIETPGGVAEALNRYDDVYGGGRLDRERCERCRNLWQRLDDARERRSVSPDIFVMRWTVISECGRDLRAAAWWAWMRAGRLV